MRKEGGDDRAEGSSGSLRWIWLWPGAFPQQVPLFFARRGVGFSPNDRSLVPKHEIGATGSALPAGGKRC